MWRAAIHTGFALALGLGATGLTEAQDDTKPAATTPAAKRPNWSNYTFVTDVVGEIVKADDKSLTVRVTWLGLSGNGRPRLSANHRNFHNPHAMHRPSTSRAQVKQQHHDYILEFVPESLVRLKTLPQKKDEKGTPVPRTQAEYDEARNPIGVTGYTASTSDLVPGTIVDVQIVRDKKIAADKATEDDLRVKYAIILGQNPITPAGPSAPDKKKK